MRRSAEASCDSGVKAGSILPAARRTIRCHCGATVAAIRAGLAADRRAEVERACQRLVDSLVGGYRVPPVRVRVLAQRPSDEYGELHGLYEPEEDGRPARITVWMRTAARRQVVAFKSFLRTVVHELCHHLDYELFALEDSPLGLREVSGRDVRATLGLEVSFGGLGVNAYGTG